MNMRPLLTRDKQRALISCALITFAWGLLAHGFGLSNSLFSHDSLNAVFASAVEENWKLELGRFLVPVYRLIVRKGLAMPWLIGMLGFAFISLTAYLTAELFETRSTGALVLISGILCCNLSVSALVAAYIYEFDIDMLALLLSVCAVYIWRTRKRGRILGAIPLACSLALYQAYIAMAITLCLMLCAKTLIETRDTRRTLSEAVKAALMLLFSGLLYGAGLLAVRALFKTEFADTSNGLGRLKDILSLDTLKNLLRSWIICFGKFKKQIPAYSAFTQLALSGFIMLCGAGALVMRLRKDRPGKRVFCLLLLICALMPFGISVTFVLTGGMFHDLMTYPLCCVYLFCVYLVFGARADIKAAAWPKRALAALLSVVLFGSLQSANALYLKKDLEKQATLSYMTRAVERIEACEGYERGVTPVAVYGLYIYEDQTIYGFEPYTHVTGSRSSSSIDIPWRRSYFSLYEAYFNYILNSDVKTCELDDWYRILDSEELKAMPAFPDKDCVRMLDGVLVLKMGEKYNIPQEETE